jgi:hypothetical protein
MMLQIASGIRSSGKPIIDIGQGLFIKQENQASGPAVFGPEEASYLASESEFRRKRYFSAIRLAGGFPGAA